MTMTLSPEERALLLSNDILDHGMVPIISTKCRALIAQAIRQAENDALERAATRFDNHRKFRGLYREEATKIIRALKSEG